jgi:hypothetical protein
VRRRDLVGGLFGGVLAGLGAASPAGPARAAAAGIYPGLGLEAGGLDAGDRRLLVVVRGVARDADRAEQGLVPVPGGVLIRRDGRLLGAVGISGDTSDNDEKAGPAGEAAPRPARTPPKSPPTRSRRRTASGAGLGIAAATAPTPRPSTRTGPRRWPRRRSSSTSTRG